MDVHLLGAQMGKVNFTENDFSNIKYTPSAFRDNWPK
jgi:hypothetical protein